MVVYCKSVHFNGFEDAKKNLSFYEMSSYKEGKAVKLAEESGERDVTRPRAGASRSSCQCVARASYSLNGTLTSKTCLEPREQFRALLSSKMCSANLVITVYLK